MTNRQPVGLPMVFGIYRSYITLHTLGKMACSKNSI